MRKRIACDRWSFGRSLVLLFGLWWGISCCALAADPERVVLSMPGPNVAPMLPLELIPRIGADKAEGFQLELRYFGGGPPAAKDMLGEK